MRRLRDIGRHGLRLFHRKSIQVTLSIYFTVAAVVCMLAMGFLLYDQFTTTLQNTIMQENQQLINQIALNINNYTRNMLRVSESTYYRVIKGTDLSTTTLDNEMKLLYEANSQLLSIALYSEEGELLAATPVSSPKSWIDVTQQEWFQKALSVIENTHFSTPHVQNLFDTASYSYSWAISMSRMVELNRGGVTSMGVLLVDMKYSGIEEIFTQMTNDNAGYVYLIDSSGEIIYHPNQKLIFSRLMNENNLAAADYTDGIHEETFEGATRQVVVKTVNYTGWRVVSVVPNTAFALGFGQMRLWVIGIVGFSILLIMLLNSLVSSRVANPIKKLDKSVRALDKGDLDLDIYIGGPYEIEHLGKTVQKTVDQMRTLMDEMVEQQEQKRKSEFDALQAQINPHFLYNTLDSIVWMVESEQYAEAISMVTALASLFRISLSRGSNIIPLRTELQHAKFYLHIQNIRYKNKFQVHFDIQPEIEQCITIKLVVQPLLENAIYHAMEMMDGDGEIHIRGWRDGDDVYVEVADNGLGMTEDKVAGLLNGGMPPRPGRSGSGIGVRNVHQRIGLYFGPQYGLEISSELDVGTTVRIHLPYHLPEDEGKAVET